jgi:hypothetical protein
MAEIKQRYKAWADLFRQTAPLTLSHVEMLPYLVETHPLETEFEGLLADYYRQTMRDHYEIFIKMMTKRFRDQIEEIEDGGQESRMTLSDFFIYLESMNITFCEAVIPRIAHQGYLPGQSGQEVLRTLVKIFSNHVRLSLKEIIKSNAEYMRFLPWDLFHCIGAKIITATPHKIHKYNLPEAGNTGMTRLQRWQKLVADLDADPMEATRYTFDRMYVLEMLVAVQSKRKRPEIRAQVRTMDRHIPIYRAALDPFHHFYQRRYVVAAQAAEKYLRTQHRDLQLTFSESTAGCPNSVISDSIHPLRNQFNPNAIRDINNDLTDGDYTALDEFREDLPPPPEPSPSDNPDP